MNRPSVLEVRLYEAVIGTLTLVPGDRTIFSFDAAYVEDSNRPTLSLSFKSQAGGLLTDLPPTQTRIPTFFSNLLPEGTLRSYLAGRARVSEKPACRRRWCSMRPAKWSSAFSSAGRKNALTCRSTVRSSRQSMRICGGCRS